MSEANPATSVPVTRAVANIASSLTYSELPADVVYLAKQCFLDWLGVTLAGSREPLTQILRDEVTEQGGHPQATLVGTTDRVSIQQAALVNGAASHALDYDDVHQAMSGHPTVPVVPGLLALAEQRGASGKDFITAFVAGFEAECRVGLLVSPGHYGLGFHATGTLGTFGSAAACASLLNLNEDQWLNAMGIAAAQAAGLKSMFGTMCKPFHAGKAAANGLLAASLASRGFTSNTEALETEQGFAATQSRNFNPDRALAGTSTGFAIRGVLFKYHAACYGTHSSIEGILKLKEEHHLEPGDVAAIELRVPVGALAMCNIHEPKTALEGKFSLRFTSALALGPGDTQETSFTDSRVLEPDLVAIRDRVTVIGEDDVVRGTQVTLRLSDGRELREAVDVNIPATDLDRQWQRLAAKFRGLAAPVIGERQAEDLLDMVAGLDSVSDMARVLRLCTPAAAVGASA